jgi:hypothetical protein
MGILQVLAHAGLSVKKRANWIAVFDERPEFRHAFDTDRVGKVKDACFYVTPRKLAMPAGRLIKGLGYELLHLPSADGTRNVLYPGFGTTGLSDGELAAFVMHLREAIDNRIATAA